MKSRKLWAIALVTVMAVSTIGVFATATLEHSGASAAGTPRAVEKLPQLGRPLMPVSASDASLGSSAQAVNCPLPAAQCTGSYNWGGYAVAPPAGGVTQVRGSWIVPYITGSNPTTCPDIQGTWDDSSVWIGIDGFNTDTVEQTGTASDCFYGETSYYAWYEFYPAATIVLPGTVNPGDQISAVVTYAGVDSSGVPTFYTSITDFTERWSVTSPTTEVPGAELGSAEWIDESAYYNGFLGLTKTVQVPFFNAVATIAGTTAPIWGWGTNVYWIVMVDYNFPNDPVQQYVKGEPGAIYRFDSGFEVTWYTYGP